LRVGLSEQQPDIQFRTAPCKCQKKIKSLTS
jgi:hypothetical protein